MTRAIRSEFRKFFTTRLWWGMAIGVFLAGAIFSGVFGWLYTSNLPGTEELGRGTPEQIANSVYTGGLSVGYLLMLTIGILQIGSEYRHKTITGTLLATPKRLQAMLAKVVALLGIGALYGVISLAGSVSVGATVLTLRDADAFPSTAVLRTLALSLLALGLWALIGLGVGILIPNQVAAILVGVGVAWIVEPLLGLAFGAVDVLRSVSPYLPSQATSAMVEGVTQPTTQVTPLAWWAAALVLAAYALVLSGLGTWRATRQDVT